VGDGAYLVAAPLLAAFITRDPVAVAIVSAATVLPWLVVGPWAGAIVDRVPRRRVMITSDVVRAATLAFLVVLIATESASIAALAITSFVIVSGKAFFDAAAQASLPAIVGRDGSTLTRANGRLYAAETVGQSVAGPPLGGLTFAVAPWAPFVLDALSFGLSGALLSRMPRGEAPQRQAGQSVRAAIREGFVYVLRHRELLALSLAVAGYNIAYNMGFATLVLFVLERLGTGGFGFGLLVATSALGAVVVGWKASSLVRVLGARGAVLAAGGAQALAWVGLSMLSSPWLAAPAFAVLGGATTLVTVAVVSERQAVVPDHMLGRVVSAFRLVGNGLAPLGSVIGGLIAAGAGLRAPLLAAAGFMALTLGAFQLWRMGHRE
jgi:MFS family permease